MFAFPSRVRCRPAPESFWYFFSTATPRVASALLCCLACAGCKLKSAIPDETARTDGGEPIFCADEGDGTWCGEGKHCVSGRCIHERCGDGIVSDGEACDDGNRVHLGDGCSNRCEVEIEEDGGSEPEADACAENCSASMCGDGVVDTEAGEVCDGPRVARVGEGESFGCSADCTQKQAYACAECQAARCADYQGLGMNLVDGCFKQVNPEYGADSNDGAFIQQCVDLVNCALAHGCGFGDDAQGAGCYCGDKALAECVTDGPAQDAPCLVEFRAAARSQSHNDVFARFTDTAFPVGWGYLMLDCYRTECADSCVPD